MSTAPKTAEVVRMARERRYCRREQFGVLFPDCISNRYAIVIIRVMECYRHSAAGHKNVSISIIQHDWSVCNRFFYFYAKFT